jgi:tetratricopeptide (TPR) repeat protein
MLETVRQFSQELLDESGEGPEIRRRHLDYFIEFSKNARELDGPDQGVWIARFLQEQENLLLAHRWCDRIDDGADLGIKLIATGVNFWSSLAAIRNLRFGFKVVTEALARAGAKQETPEHMKTLLVAGDIAFRMGRYEEARTYLKPCVELARSCGNKADLSKAIKILAHAMLNYQDEFDVTAAYQEALALARESGDQSAIAGALISSGEWQRLGGDLDGSWALYEEALAIARKVGDRRCICLCLQNQSRVSISKGELRPVPAMALESLNISEQDGMKGLALSVLDLMTGLEAGNGNWELGARYYGAVEAKDEETDYRREPADEAYMQPIAERIKRELGPEAFQTAYDAGRALTIVEVLAEVRERLTSS